MTDSLQTSRHHNFSGNPSRTIDGQGWKLGTHEGPMEVIYSFFRVLDLLLLLIQVPNVSCYDFFLVFLLFDVSVRLFTAHHGIHLRLRVAQGKPSHMSTLITSRVYGFLGLVAFLLIYCLLLLCNYHAHLRK